MVVVMIKPAIWQKDARQAGLIKPFIRRADDFDINSFKLPKDTFKWFLL